MDDTEDETAADSFTRELQRLKRRGCNLLVTGEVREEVSHRMTQKLLGATDIPRTRVLALTDQDQTDAPDLLPPGIDSASDDVHLLDYGCGTRAADVAASSSSEGEWSPNDLDHLQTTICNTIATARDADFDFEPGELRLSVFTLAYLVGQHDAGEIERFVLAVGDHVRGVSGMGHYHLPLSDDSETVRRLSPLFDARIELREKRGRPEQRWHLSEPNLTTSWVGL